MMSNHHDHLKQFECDLDSELVEVKAERDKLKLKLAERDADEKTNHARINEVLDAYEQQVGTLLAANASLVHQSAKAISDAFKLRDWIVDFCTEARFVKNVSLDDAVKYLAQFYHSEIDGG